MSRLKRKLRQLKELKAKLRKNDDVVDAEYEEVNDDKK